MTARKMPVRTHEFELSDDWAGWKFTAKTNIPLGTFERLQTGRFTEVTDVLASILVDWNFVDEEGEPLKALNPKWKNPNGNLSSVKLPSEEIPQFLTGPCLETVRLLPIDLGTLIMRTVTEHIQILPNR